GRTIITRAIEWKSYVRRYRPRIGQCVPRRDPDIDALAADAIARDERLQAVFPDEDSSIASRAAEFADQRSGPHRAVLAHRACIDIEIAGPSIACGLGSPVTPVEQPVPSCFRILEVCRGSFACSGIDHTTEISCLLPRRVLVLPSGHPDVTRHSL